MELAGPQFSVMSTLLRSTLGESPWWDGERFSWVDIREQKIHSCLLDGSDLVTIPTPSQIGFAIPTDDGRWIAGLTDGLWAARRDSDDPEWERIWRAPHDTEILRINDAKTDPRGRLWFGSMSYAEVEPLAALYRFDHGVVDLIRPGVITSNGLGWSPDGRRFYHTDSLYRRIDVYDYDAETGEAANAITFAQDPSDYVPDGLAVDSEGFVWSCKWDGGKIVRYSPAGDVVGEIAVPVERPTSCCFVGDSLSTLAITTALPGDFSTREGLNGRVLLLETDTHGCRTEHVAI